MIRKDKRTLGISLIALATSLIVAVGCESTQTTVEKGPTGEQKVVMVPSQQEGKPIEKPANTAGEAPSLAPGSTPDKPQPGDADYKGGN